MDYLPEVYQDFLREHSVIAEAYATLSRTCKEAGTLDEKTRELVQLGIAIGLGSEGAVRSHARRSLAAGSAAEDIRSVVLLSLTTAGFPAMIAAMKWVEEVIARH